MQTVYLRITGLSCQHCVQKLREGLSALPMVKEVQIDRASGVAKVILSMQTGAKELSQLVDVIGQIGYKARIIEPLDISQKTSSRSFAIQGMSCASCEQKVRRIFAEIVPGLQVEIDRHAGQILLHSPVDEKTLTHLQKRLEEAGYRLVPLEMQGKKLPWFQRLGVGSWKFNILFGGTAFALLATLEWLTGLIHERWAQWLAFGLALPVQLLCGGRFYANAWGQLRRLHANMDALVALGSTAAFLLSLVTLLLSHKEHTYFMEAVGIITLVSLGHWLEERISSKAASAIKSLIELAPPLARRLSEDGTVQLLSADLILKGDKVLVLPGDRIPVDGLVTEGEAYVDESMLTGEPTPRLKRNGAAVFAGTVSQDGRLVVVATATGQHTVLAHIVRTVERAQTAQGRLQRLADKISSVFVPAVLFIAIADACAWMLFYPQMVESHGQLARFLWSTTLPASAWAAGIIHAVSVLIIACPCAMGLATPAALMAATAVAARKGILIRDPLALERCGHISVVLFDKTGTLTEGRPSLCDLWIQPGLEADPLQILQKAAQLSAASAHPLSQALNQELTQLLPAQLRSTASEPSHVNEQRGCGVQLCEKGIEWRLGRVDWAAKTSLPTEANALIEQWLEKGCTVIALAQDGQLQALFCLRDQLRKEAKETVQRLMARLGQVYIVTGDSGKVAKAFAEELGIGAEQVIGEVMPEQKALLIEELRRRTGKRIAFVGDGINDAPALQAADLGIAVAQASDLARETADLLLMRPNLLLVYDALIIARAALRTIYQNLFWAFFYNAAAVPLAALGFIHPLLCAAAMGLSDLLVLGNALRLVWRFRY